MKSASPPTGESPATVTEKGLAAYIRRCHIFEAISAIRTMGIATTLALVLLVDHRGSLIGLVTAPESALLLRDSILPPAAFPCVLCVRLLPSTDIDDCATSRERVQH